MADRFPPALLFLIVLMTVAVLIVTVTAIREDEAPFDRREEPAEAAADQERGDPEPGGAPTPGPPPSPTGEIGAPAPAPPSVTRVQVVWERLDAPRPAAPDDDGAAWSGRTSQPPPLPEVRDRLHIRTSPADGGVMEVRTVHGSPLECTAQRVPGSAVETVVEVRGYGRHARILELVTGSGARVRRFHQPGTPGGPERRVELTPPGPVEGTVLSAAGQPLAGASVRVGAAIAVTGGQGRFRIDGVRGRTVLAYVTAPGHAPHRAIWTGAGEAGTTPAPDTSPVIRLLPGVRLEARVRYPDGFARDGRGFRFYLIPFGHRLALDALAVERLGPRDTGASDALVVTGFPVDQEMCLVGLHPGLNVIYRRLRAHGADLRLDLAAEKQTEVRGTVVRREDGRPVTDFQLDTPLDTLTIGEHLVARRQIPGGHEPGNFPLPVLSQALLHHDTDGRGGFRVTFDGSVRRAVALRFRAPGLRTEVVPASALHPRLEVRMGEETITGRGGASVELAVRLAGRPRIESHSCTGLDLVSNPLIDPGLLRAVFGNVPPGRYRIRVEATGFASYTRNVNFTDATSRRISVYLAAR